MPTTPELVSLVRRFLDGAEALHPVIDGLTEQQLDSHPVPGTWSLRELVIHVMDSDLIATHRMKRIVAEELPLLISYDETAFAKKLYGPHLSARLACDLFRLNRMQMAEILDKLPEEAFAREGVHNQRGKVTLREMVGMYVHHVDHHNKFATEKRRVMGK